MAKPFPLKTPEGHQHKYSGRTEEERIEDCKHKIQQALDILADEAKDFDELVDMASKALQEGVTGLQNREFFDMFFREFCAKVNEMYNS